MSDMDSAGQTFKKRREHKVAISSYRDIMASRTSCVGSSYFFSGFCAGLGQSPYLLLRLRRRARLDDARAEAHNRLPQLCLHKGINFQGVSIRTRESVVGS